MPPENRLPKEFPPAAPGICPPPAEGSAGASADERGEGERSRIAAQKRKKSALLLALAGLVLCGVIRLAPSNPAAAVQPPAETAAADPVTESAQPSPPAVLTDAERLVAVGTWKNAARNEWVHFNADGSGWWYDGTYFGRMVWEEAADGSVTYEAGMSYLSPERTIAYDWFPEQDGNRLQCAESGGSIALPAEEDRFTCPGLRFGEGSFLPDNTAIDASVMDGVCGESAAALLSGTAWHTSDTSDLGIPVAPSLEGGKTELYTDLVYVQYLDFSAGTLRLATRDDGLLWREDWSAVGDSIYDDAADTLDVSFLLVSGEERASATFDVQIDTTFGYFSDLRPGDVEYNNLHFLWGRQIGSSPTPVYLLITSAGVFLGIDSIDLFPDNFSLLSAD